MNSTQISYRKTIVGWYNVTLVETGATYNVQPQRFIEITGASPKAFVGCMAIDGAQLVALLTDRWTRTITPACVVAV